MAKQYTTRVTKGTTKFSTTFTIGDQTFTIYNGKSKSVAKWYQRMIQYALQKLIDDTEN